MKLLKLSVIALTAGLAVGCASTSDIERLDGEVGKLKTDVASAKDAANEASAKAASAEAAANRAANTAEEVNTKLDRMFKHSMQK
jgi:murein lipoprotein